MCNVQHCSKRFLSLLVSWTPNLLSISRMLSPILVVFLYLNGYLIPSFLVFLFSAASDFLDGFVARKCNVSSLSGAALDAVADKVLSNSLFIFFYLRYQIPDWLLAITLLRDLGIVIVAPFFLLKNHKPNVLFISKVNTTLQFILLSTIFCNSFIQYDLSFLERCLIYMTGLTTILSAISYSLMLAGVWHAKRKS